MTASAAAARRAWVEAVMGTRISLHLRGDGLVGTEVEQAVSQVYAGLRQIEAMFSPFRADSQVTAINSGELAVSECDPLVREVMDLCDLARERTDGFFDAAIPLPKPRARQVGPLFNPTGLVKGWAVERAARQLRELVDHDFCLNAGGDIMVGGSWRMGIEDPADPGRLVARVQVTDGAIATSGTTYRGGHVVSPPNGVPARDLLAATVIGPSLTWADVYATAAVARGGQALRWLDHLADYAGLVVKSDGTALVTSDWPVFAG